MADLARILALPPPRSYSPKPGTLLRPADDARPNGNAGGKNLPAGQAGQADAAEEAMAQAKRFRFRVHDGATRNTQSTDLQRDEARTAGTRQRVAAEADSVKAGAANADTSATESKGIATFLAQLISQEQLGQGLHVPPVKAADLAYRRAGGEPTLDIGSPARFSLAV